MPGIKNRTDVKRIPRQDRSHARFESVLETAQRLFAARGYESISMREIAREAHIPIASVYQYFPMKLAIVREIWTRYTSDISKTLKTEARSSILQERNQSNHLIGVIIDRMAALQSSNPAFIEIWSCVAASIELRALNVEDTLQNARVIADALQGAYPESDKDALFDRALIAIEMASATTRLALTLSEPHRSRVLLSLKDAISLLIDPVTLQGLSASPTVIGNSASDKTSRKVKAKKKSTNAKAGLSSR